MDHPQDLESILNALVLNARHQQGASTWRSLELLQEQNTLLDTLLRQGEDPLGNT